MEAGTHKVIICLYQIYSPYLRRTKQIWNYFSGRVCLVVITQKLQQPSGVFSAIQLPLFPSETGIGAQGLRTANNFQFIYDIFRPSPSGAADAGSQ